MKKLLVLSLVLALCSISSAALIINITDGAGASEITLLPSQEVELLVWYSWAEGTLGGFDVEIGSDNHLLGTLGQPVITAVGRDSAYDWADLGFTLDWELVAASAIGGGLGQGLNAPLARVIFHCEGPGDVLITGIDTYTVNNANPRIQVTPEFGSLIIHQIPEPATIAVLSLGGLLLRRKK